MGVNNGFYNVLFGTNDDYIVLLGMLNLTEKDFGRFRDIYLNKDGTKIIVYTRCGGGNREDYKEVFDRMSKHPNYVKDYDDDFDNTYCYFEFSVPDKFKITCKQMSTGEEPLTVSEKFNKHIKELDEMTEDEAMNELFKVLNSCSIGMHELKQKEDEKDG